MAVRNPAVGLPLNLPGATQPTRYVGGTTSGAPASGAFAVGDFVIDLTGNVWVCTSAGSPGTWGSLSRGIELGYAEITANQSGISATADITGLSLTFATTTKAAMIEFFVPLYSQVTSSGIGLFYITDSANNELGRGGGFTLAAGGFGGGLSARCRVAAGTPSATYKARAGATAGTVTINASNTGASTYKPFIRAYEV